MSTDLDPADYSMVVKSRAPLPRAWRWEIYRAGRQSPVWTSSVFFDSMTTANKAGKEALSRFLDNRAMSGHGVRA